MTSLRFFTDLPNTLAIGESGVMATIRVYSTHIRSGYRSCPPS